MKKIFLNTFVLAIVAGGFGFSVCMADKSATDEFFIETIKALKLDNKGKEKEIEILKKEVEYARNGKKLAGNGQINNYYYPKNQRGLWALIKKTGKYGVLFLGAYAGYSYNILGVKDKIDAFYNEKKAQIKLILTNVKFDTLCANAKKKWQQYCVDSADKEESSGASSSTIRDESVNDVEFEDDEESF
jgi:hypothetical protein